MGGARYLGVWALFVARFLLHAVLHSAFLLASLNLHHMRMHRCSITRACIGAPSRAHAPSVHCRLTASLFNLRMQTLELSPATLELFSKWCGVTDEQEIRRRAERVHDMVLGRTGTWQKVGV